MNWFQRILKRKKPKSNKPVSSAAEIMGVIMMIGDRGDLADFQLIKRAILVEGEKGVRFAALKRLHNFKEADGFEEFLDELESKDSFAHLEPYYSMALIRCGRISEEDFTNRMNKSN